jgi:hypothetical protein
MFFPLPPSAFPLRLAFPLRAMLARGRSGIVPSSVQEGIFTIHFTVQDLIVNRVGIKRVLQAKAHRNQKSKPKNGRA